MGLHTIGQKCLKIGLNKDKTKLIACNGIQVMVYDLQDQNVETRAKWSYDFTAFEEEIIDFELDEAKGRMHVLMMDGTAAVIDKQKRVMFTDLSTNFGEKCF
jgi:hypothetical protein